jgi:hypothetical protein
LELDETNDYEDSYGEYYSAYYDSTEEEENEIKGKIESDDYSITEVDDPYRDKPIDENTSGDDSELGALITPRSANKDYISDEKVNNNDVNVRPAHRKKQHISHSKTLNYYPKRREERLSMIIGHNIPGNRPHNLAKSLPVAKNSPQIRRIRDKKLRDDAGKDEVSSSTDPSLPSIPDQDVIPPIVRPLPKASIYATLSRKLDLKHPCSPRLSESRNQLIEAQKVLDLQTMLFDLRMQFWRIENSREQAIENYHNLAGEAGFMICNNCKRLLRDLKLVEKLGNYHMKKQRSITHRSHKPRYKCTERTYDEHFISTPAGKFFPLSLEK